MKLLALRLCEHDSNFTYFDGTTLRYFKSERTSQIKHHGFSNVWEWRNVVKEIWDLDFEELDEIAIVFDPWVHNLPLDNEDFFPAIEYEFFPAKCKVWRVSHHLAHSLSTWMLTDRDPDVSIVLDGYGDRDRSWTVFKNQQPVAHGSLEVNGSFGTEMAQAGRYLGVKADVDLDLAGKVMGLQSYGTVNEAYLKEIKKYGVESAKDLFSLMSWFNFHGDVLVGNLQALDWIKTCHTQAGSSLLEFFKQYVNKDDLVSFTGGVAQNVIWNTELKSHFKNLVIPPHCADDGLSLGAIEWLRRRHNLPKFTLENFPFIQHDTTPAQEPSLNTIKETAKLLADGKTVAWYQGHGELGPRALGNRSILFNPTIENGRNIVNKIKNRETFRPFGASVLAEHKTELFDIEFDNPYMLFVGNTKASNLNSITHVDGTCRVQTVANDGSHFRLLLEEFYKLTGCPVLLNTSLNVAGRPIAGHPNDAVELYNQTGLDCLVIGDQIIQK